MFDVNSFIGFETFFYISSRRTFKTILDHLESLGNVLGRPTLYVLCTTLVIGLCD